MIGRLFVLPDSVTPDLFILLGNIFQKLADTQPSKCVKTDLLGATCMA